ncbi:hypothetical protein CRI94_11710 [Longibacter salinarum]|uniref:Uncharacterized protein n=1 Tax=Longibacter salinarum TaxID=1850348 RepID=A0A2A8CXJ6_9BACT|nr:hypothetical protein [Longibacter salinarum]PEN13297.1 hypothetical protein CRI94_11710 [Longibacter salinarum]
MPNSLSVFRIPVEDGADLLYGRLSTTDIKQRRPSRIEGSSQRVWTDDSLERPVWNVVLATHYKRILDVLTETVHDAWAKEFVLEERSDPRYNAIYGSRLSGWSRTNREPIIDYIHPLRYNCRSDIFPIVRTLDEITNEQVRARIDQVAASEKSRTWLKEHMLEHVIPLLRRCYQETKETGEMTIHWLH